jgi:HPt (histidine-containing phosphotransfer) domain-containing protein
MDQPTATRIEAQLAVLWQRNLPTLLERLDLLDRVAASSPLTPEDQKAARDIAHKLAGNLGMFGHQRASEIARRLELLLAEPQADPFQLAPLTSELRQVLFPTA